MNLLGAKLYDPSGAVSKSTASLLAMTAFDTTNLRLTVTVPSHGYLFVRIMCNLSGATTMPQVLLGVINGTTARCVPLAALPGTALATTNVPLVAEFTIPGLTPGSITLDAAYGVETVVAATNIHYGGPNNTTGNDAWGAIAFQIWDPQPFQTNGQIVVDSSGRLDISKVSGTAQTARDLGAQCDTTISSRMATYTQPSGFLAATFPTGTIANTTNITAGTITTVTTTTTATNLTNLPTIPSNWITAAGIAATALNGKGDWNVGKTGYALTQAFPSNFSSLGIDVGGNLSGSVASVVGSVGSVTGLTASNLDAAISTRLATTSYTAPDNASVTAIKAKTDSITFTVAGKVDANTTYIKGQAITGTGTEVDPWGP
jgi:hypothetical protein